MSLLHVYTYIVYVVIRKSPVLLFIGRKDVVRFNSIYAETS